MRRALVRDGGTGAPYFFFSHAHVMRNGDGSPEVDYWMARLFRDLHDRVSELTAMPSGWQAGYMDCVPPPPGGRRRDPADALAACRVFVPVYSRRYFESEDCGKEWSAFARRLAAHDTGGSPPIVPALWVPVAENLIPLVARVTPCDYADIASYASNGFYGIIKLSRYRADYQHAVGVLASHIVAAAERSPAPDGLASGHAALESAFGTEPRDMSNARPLRISLAAPTQDELPDGRSAQYYGASALDWQPYKQESPVTLAEYIADAARGLGYRPIVGGLQEHGAELLGTGRPSAPELLVVDPWAALVEKYRELLRRLDVMDKPWVQVIVPWDWADEQSAAQRSRLRGALDGALGRKLAAGTAASTLAGQGIPTLADLSQVLRIVAAKAGRQYLRHAPAGS